MKTNQIVKFLLAFICTALISFFAGMTVEATKNHYKISQYQKEIKEIREQLSSYRSEVSHLRKESGNNIGKMDWVGALDKVE